MNERILWPKIQQAREYAITTDTSTGAKNFNIDLFHEKFAELIVQECCDMVNKHQKSFRDANSPHDCILVLDIKDHFGMSNYEN